MKLAFAGFRHGHVMGLYDYARAHDQVDVVATCEEDAPTADALRAAGKVSITHNDYRKMLDTVDCDAVAVGDYFSKRGRMILAALEAGKHVIADKPVCTSLAELDQIETLLARKNLTLGCLLDLRDTGAFRTLRRIVHEGQIGEILTVTILAQHPLMWGKRAGWYFEEGKQSGTINDIGIHAIDLIPWVTGRQIVQVVAARGWNAKVKEVPWFCDGAQIMLRLDNGGGVLGDLSYLSPDGLAYSAPQYWRMTCHGSLGMAETWHKSETVDVADDSDKSVRRIPVDSDRPGGVLGDFLAQIKGKSEPSGLTMAEVLSATRKSLMIQHAADKQLSGIAL